MDIYFCDVCATRVTDADFKRGFGLKKGEVVVCGGCIEKGLGSELLAREEARQPVASAPILVGTGAIDSARDRAATLPDDGPAETFFENVSPEDDTDRVSKALPGRSTSESSGFKAMASGMSNMAESREPDQLDEDNLFDDAEFDQPEQPEQEESIPSIEDLVDDADEDLVDDAAEDVVEDPVNGVADTLEPDPVEDLFEDDPEPIEPEPGDAELVSERSERDDDEPHGSPELEEDVFAEDDEDDLAPSQDVSDSSEDDGSEESEKNIETQEVPVDQLPKSEKGDNAEKDAAKGQSAEKSKKSQASPGTSSRRRSSSGRRGGNKGAKKAGKNGKKNGKDSKITKKDGKNAKDGKKAKDSKGSSSRRASSGKSSKAAAKSSGKSSTRATRATSARRVKSGPSPAVVWGISSVTIGLLLVGVILAANMGGGGDSNSGPSVIDRTSDLREAIRETKTKGQSAYHAEDLSQIRSALASFDTTYTALYDWMDQAEASGLTENQMDQYLRKMGFYDLQAFGKTLREKAVEIENRQ